MLPLGEFQYGSGTRQKLIGSIDGVRIGGGKGCREGDWSRPIVSLVMDDTHRVGISDKKTKAMTAAMQGASKTGSLLEEDLSLYFKRVTDSPLTRRTREGGVFPWKMK